MTESEHQELYQNSCSICGAKASAGDSREHAEKLAVAEGFQKRPIVHGFKWLCEDCGTVKAMNTTSAEYVESRKRATDIKIDKTPIADKE